MSKILFSIIAVFGLFSASAQLSDMISNFFVGEIVETLDDPQAQQDRIQTLNELKTLYTNRANSCEADLATINRDLISTQLHDDIIDNNTFRMVSQLNHHLGVQLRPGMFWGAYRANYDSNYTCNDMLERQGLGSMPRSMGLQIQTGPLKSQVCENYDRMIQCFRNVEDVMLEESIIIYHGPRYYQMEYFDEGFIKETFPSDSQQQ